MSQGPYWFARRYPVGDPHNNMSPVSAEGFRVAYRFIWAMVLGGVAMVALGLVGFWLQTDSPVLGWSLCALGVIVYLAATAYGAWSFISQSRDRGDHQHTIEDYKAGRVPGQLPFKGR